ncbi:hypothetical protein HWV62_40669 [Athelia sp. TMB]|nr:hypothetical protein HWV62_40669 [Athelia sp. TMB]
MPTKRQNAPALSRHARSTSGGAGKAGLNLQFTQKDPATTKLQDKMKKNGYGNEQRNPSFQRVASGIRTAPVAREPPPLMTRKYSQQSTTKSGGGKQKPGFTISSSGDDEEDEWVSSEAGSEAVSPADSESDDDEHSPERSRTPVEVAKPAPPVRKDTSFQVATPRAESVLSRVATLLPPVAAEVQAPAPLKRAPSEVHTRDFHQHRQHPEPPARRESRSEHTSPTQAHHRHEHSKHSSVTRPPSMHSIRTEVPLRPHPLIRGQSYGQGVALGPPAKPTPLAPLTVTSGSQAAQISSSPPGPSTSPTSIRTAHGPQASPTRPTSIGSAQSAATLPVSPQIPNKVPDRVRTMSTMSNSSFAALASLAHLPTQSSRPPTPQQYTSQFPPTDSHHHIESMHPLLPPPYLNVHLTVLATRSPIREAFDRVVRAKQSVRG